MKKIIVNTYLCLLSLLFFTGCLEESGPPVALDFSTPTSWFDGVQEVENIGGSSIGISISWNANIAASGYRIYLLAANPNTGVIGWSVVETITDPTIETYAHRDANLLKAGRIYTYMVKAIDFAGIEDPNVEQKSTIGFEGITTVQILSRTSAKVTVNTAGSFSQLKVIATPTRVPAASTTLINTFSVSKTFSSSVNEIILNDLIPGTTYSFQALALLNDGEDDGNNLIIKAQTPSDSFGTGSASETLSSYQYRNVRLVQAFGDAPNEMNTTTAGSTNPWFPPEITETVNPHKRVVRIVPNPFANSSGNFRVIRTAGVGLIGNSVPNTFDTTTTTRCQAIQSGSTTVYDDNSCVVCDHNAAASPNVRTGECDLTFLSGPPMFIDKSIAPPKKKYFYTIVKVASFQVSGQTETWPEELPLVNAKDFLFAAHIPDNYMVLVQRDSVNYEMCGLINKTPDPKKSNNCAYRGVGATAYNTAGVIRNTQAGFYDFGYNLLVDRHALACNWTGSETKDPTLENSYNPITLPRAPSLDCARDANDVNSGLCVRAALALGTGGQNASFASESTPGAAPANTFENPITAPQAGDCETNGDANCIDKEVFLPVGIGFKPSLYASSPLTAFNIQARGNNCYSYYFSRTEVLGGVTDASALSTSTKTNGTWLPVGYLADLGLNLNSATRPTFKSEIAKLVQKAATIDPGPIVNFNGQSIPLRKKPTITGLTNSQAQALCASQQSSYGSKRLMRRREFIAASAFPSMAGEPGFRSKADMASVISGTDGQTFYDLTDPINLPNYGDATSAGLGTNPGGCDGAQSPNRNGISINPAFCRANGGCNTSFNVNVNPLNSDYCNIPGGCPQAQNTSNSFFSTSTPGNRTNDSSTDNLVNVTAYLNQLLYPLNEIVRIGGINAFDGNSSGPRFAIGSLATNKCVSRFGMHDPIPSAENGNGPFPREKNTAQGFVLSDQFLQKSQSTKHDNPPQLVPSSNPIDRGVVFDYSYENGTKFIEFSNLGSGFISVGLSGSASKTCTSDDPNSTTNTAHWWTDNYYYLSSDSTAALTQPQMAACISEDPLTVTTSSALSNTASKNQNNIAGFVPAMGLPLGPNALALNSNQDFVDTSAMIFSNQFANSAAGKQTYARFLSSDTTGQKVVNMTTGLYSRWSFEISESATANNSGIAWCAVEAE